ILFLRTREVKLRQIVWPGRFWPGWVAAVLFGVMPVLNFFDCWDSYLSAALYSGNTLNAEVHLSEEVKGKLPEEVQRNYVRLREEERWDAAMHRRPYKVNFFDWATSELNVPCYPARRVYRQLARKLALLGESAEDVVLMIEERPDWQTGKRKAT